MLIAAVVIGWLSLVGAYEYTTRDDPDKPPLCLLKRFTGQPCPTCGSTRAVLAIGRGDVAGAFLFNPFVVTALPVAALWLVWRFALKRRLGLSPRWRRIAWAAIAVLFIANWVYLIASGV